MQLDHMILKVNDRDESIRFYGEILGLQHEGEIEPFSVLRVSPDFTIQIAPWGTGGGDHLAFSMDAAAFDAAFERVREAGLEYGDAFDAVGNMKGPGLEAGARGQGHAVYFFDPSRHLIEIRYYD